jgi:predicted CxxxxCH...CXXCH cytochrome family protein
LKGLLRQVLLFVPGALAAGAAALLLAVLVAAALRPAAMAAAPPKNAKPLDPAAWGADHVGQKVPAYMESGECLFCHRHQVGGTWQTDKHNRTIRDALDSEPAMQALAALPATKPLAGEVELILGDTRAQKFLKRSAAYGKVDLLTAAASFGRGRRAKIDAPQNPHWDTETFATECAGCHATAVNPQTHAFATVALDCYPCHGDAPDGHTDDARLILLAAPRKDSPQVITSICASCHVRFGKSKASGLPYPTNFVAGDNLFKDFKVDWSVLDDPKLNPADRHVMDNVRDVALYGRESMTCLSCHDVHKGSTSKHRELAVVGYCQHCHDAGTPIKGHKTYEVHSERCRY